MIWFEEQGFDLENMWFYLDLIWNFVIWFKIIPNHHFLHNTTMVLRCEWSTSNDDYALYWLHCPSATVLWFCPSLTGTIARLFNSILDSYYVNWTFSKKLSLWWNWFVIWFLIWGFHLNHFCQWFAIWTCDLTCDLPITAGESESTSWLMIMKKVT